MTRSFRLMQWPVGTKCYDCARRNMRKRDRSENVNCPSIYIYIYISIYISVSFPLMLNCIAEDRFRPNIVLEDCDAHAEDVWQQIQIGFTAAQRHERKPHNTPMGTFHGFMAAGTCHERTANEGISDVVRVDGTG